ncbi:MAG: SdpI family protein [Bacteroidetes bacterium]|nr:SdpI family protein [Bacteroidota bacterium]
MQKTTNFSEWMIGLIILIPFFYLASIYNSLPEIVPIHFDLHGIPNGFGERSTLILTTSLLGLVAAGCYLLIKNLPKIDPKKTAGQSPELYKKLAWALVIFMSALNLIIVFSAANKSVNITKLMLPMIGILFSFLGYYMRDMKPSYFVGIRTPWTLENDDNWRETHILASKIWVPGGVIVTVATLVLPETIAFICFITTIVIISIIPIGYSYLYFKKHQQ